MLCVDWRFYFSRIQPTPNRMDAMRTNERFTKRVFCVRIKYFTINWNEGVESVAVVDVFRTICCFRFSLFHFPVLCCWTFFISLFLSSSSSLRTMLIEDAQRHRWRLFIYWIRCNTVRYGNQYTSDESNGCSVRNSITSTAQMSIRILHTHTHSTSFGLMQNVEIYKLKYSIPISNWNIIFA